MFKIAIILLVLITIGILLWLAYTPTIHIPEHWMDHPNTQDATLSDPTLLLSARFSDEERQQHLDRPVIITAHGFTATTFEWDAFKQYVESNSNILVSNVLVGGHGRSYEVFKSSTKEDWAAPILNEYNALVEQGYTRISLAGSSNGGALLLKLLSEGHFTILSPKHIYFIDALASPYDKQLYAAPYFGWLYKDGVPKKPIDENMEFETVCKHWYQVRSYRTLAELATLIRHNQRAFKQGIALPIGTQAHIYQSTGDRVVDPKGAALIYNGLKGSRELHMVDSSYHVFTRLDDYENPGEKALTLQKKTFDTIIQQVSNSPTL